MRFQTTWLAACSLVLVLLGGCESASKVDPVEETPWPSIPTTGWVRHGNSWTCPSWEIADYNGDGRVDYLRFQAPPFSYMHRIWVDHDHDGFFNGEGDFVLDAKHRVPVPEFEPLIVYRRQLTSASRRTR